MKQLNTFNKATKFKKEFWDRVNSTIEFMALDRTHPSEIQDWIVPFHSLQGILMNRVTRRDYPKHFNGL